MGIQLMPRIRNWKDLTFFRPDRKSKYRNIDQLFGEAIQSDLIEAGQQELMQVVISIQAGHLASPTLLRKLSYGGARNRTTGLPNGSPSAVTSYRKTIQSSSKNGCATMTWWQPV